MADPQAFAFGQEDVELGFQLQGALQGGFGDFGGGLDEDEWEGHFEGDGPNGMELWDGRPVEEQWKKDWHLFSTARRGELGQVRQLLDMGADPRAVHPMLRCMVGFPNRWEGMESSLTPVHGACSEGHEAILRLLLQRGGSPDGNLHAPSPLMVAAFHGHAACVRTLLQHWARVKCHYPDWEDRYKEVQATLPMECTVHGGDMQSLLLVQEVTAKLQLHDVWVESAGRKPLVLTNMLQHRQLRPDLHHAVVCLLRMVSPRPATQPVANSIDFVALLAHMCRPVMQEMRAWGADVGLHVYSWSAAADATCEVPLDTWDREELQDAERRLLTQEWAGNFFTQGEQRQDIAKFEDATPFLRVITGGLVTRMFQRVQVQRGEPGFAEACCVAATLVRLHGTQQVATAVDAGQARQIAELAGFAHYRRRRLPLLLRAQASLAS